MIDPRIITIAKTELTPPQLQVWEAHHNHGWPFRRIATHLDLARTTITDRYDSACRTMRRHGVQFTPDGRPYLEETDAA